jgi:hypothetical protein
MTTRTRLGEARSSRDGEIARRSYVSLAAAAVLVLPRGRSGGSDKRAVNRRDFMTAGHSRWALPARV